MVPAGVMAVLSACVMSIASRVPAVRPARTVPAWASPAGIKKTGTPHCVVTAWVASASTKKGPSSGPSQRKNHPGDGQDLRRFR